MKDCIKRLVLCASIILTLCTCSTDNVEEEQEQRTNIQEQNHANVSLPETDGNLPLERMENPDGMENNVVKPNTMTICRCNDEFGNLFPNFRDWGEVDYSRYSIIVVRIATNYGIANASYALQKAGDKSYTLSMTVETNIACVLDGDFFIFRSPRLPKDAIVDFDLNIQ